MSYFLAVGDFADIIGGVDVRFTAGEPVEVTADLAGPLVRAGVIDASRVLTPEEVAQARRRVAEIKAARDRTDAAKTIAMREHKLATGPGTVCLGRRPIDAPHYVDELLIENAASPDGTSWWAIACRDHIEWTRKRGPVDLPPRPDCTPGRYRVIHRYRANYSPRGVPYGEPVPTFLSDGGRITLEIGAVIEVPRYLAAWIERDSEGVPQRLSDDGQHLDEE